MARLLLITLLVLSNGPAYAEWTEVTFVESKGGYTAYADPAIIRRKGALVKMWQLFALQDRTSRHGGQVVYVGKRAG